MLTIYSCDQIPCLSCGNTNVVEISPWLLPTINAFIVYLVLKEDANFLCVKANVATSMTLQQETKLDSRTFTTTLPLWLIIYESIHLDLCDDYDEDGNDCQIDINSFTNPHIILRY